MKANELRSHPLPDPPPTPQIRLCWEGDEAGGKWDGLTGMQEEFGGVIKRIICLPFGAFNLGSQWLKSPTL